MPRIFLAVFAVSLISCNGALLVEPLPEAEDCNDLLDNDEDGATDCQDEDCAQSCIEVCNDGKDNDQDGDFDCQDNDCAASCAEVCDDDIDNDKDGAKDCEDTDCIQQAICDTGKVLFDETILHTVELNVDAANLANLTTGNETRVSANLIFDGNPVDNVGIRIKGFIGSVQDINGKPGFSIKVNEFVPGQDLFGVKKFTIDNAIQDPSFMSEHIGFELWRRAGIPAQRTAFARLTFNGVYYGVYVVNESVNTNFLQRNFEDGLGNLYEGVFGIDVLDVNTADLDTNEEINDRSDLQALADIISNVPDEQFVAAVSEVLDVDEFLRYWAIEALTYHWDGYAEFGTFGCCSPNNYYLYHEPSLDRILFMPHGIDQLFQDISVNVMNPPSAGASLATRLFGIPETRTRFAQAIRDVLAGPWDANVLLPRLEAALTLIQPSVFEGDHNPNFSAGNFLPSVQRVRDYLQQRPQIAEQQLIDAGF
jgi:spore coat protein H